MKIKRYAVVLAVLTVCAAAAAGCGKKDEEAAKIETVESEIPAKETEEESTAAETQTQETETAEETGSEEQENLTLEEQMSRYKPETDIICEKEGYNVYAGTIGDKKAQLVLAYPQSGEDAAEKAEKKDKKDEKEKEEDEKRMLRLITVIDGEEKEYEVDGSDLKKLTYSSDTVAMTLFGESNEKGDCIIGMYSEDGGETNEKVFLSLSHISGDVKEDEKRREMEVFAAEVKKAVLDKDMESVADMVLYPLPVKILGKEKVFEDKEAFLAYDFKYLYTDAFVKDLENETCHFMFRNSEGTMMGNGEIWLDFVEQGEGKKKTKAPRILSLSCWN